MFNASIKSFRIDGDWRSSKRGYRSDSVRQIRSVRGIRFEFCESFKCARIRLIPFPVHLSSWIFFIFETSNTFFFFFFTTFERFDKGKGIKRETRFGKSKKQHKKWIPTDRRLRKQTRVVSNKRVFFFFSKTIDQNPLFVPAAEQHPRVLFNQWTNK